MSFIETDERKELRAAVAALGKKYGSEYFSKCAKEDLKTTELWKRPVTWDSSASTCPRSMAVAGPGCTSCQS